MTLPSTRLTALREVFERRAAKGLDSFPVRDYHAGDCAALADALEELERFREAFGE